ncbi:Protein of unknown function (DUF1694) [Desulfosporosinus orientis DSM 765]|uniref:Uncharacterized protein n=1 Tax=Desulfosporosinus orientis (strain ATCC 19365 / DSM 765 / NCIMB 8382 / VKM B-1628 / Singapore I) TaxID=768706 RepID=G7W6J8_DESOD|nr:Protein of unknown function (DUF1694) [Desulfosporosinus orientis DSM 765]
MNKPSCPLQVSWKHDEKILYLGEFRERIIRRLTKKQIAETFIYPEIKEALSHYIQGYSVAA